MMRDYAKISPTFWTGDTGKSIRTLGIEAQLVALYLLTNPHANMFGLYYLPLPLINHETGLPTKKVQTILSRLQSIGFSRYDTSTEYIWVAEMAAYQIGTLDPKDFKVKGIQRAWQALPNNPFVGLFYEKYGDRYGLERRASKGLPKPMPSPQIYEQEQEIEQEQEQERDLPEKNSGPPSKPFSSPQAEIVKAFQATYQGMTSQPFKSEKKDYIVAAQLLRDYGKDVTVQKAQLLGEFCRDRSTWFTKSGWADFSLGTLSSHWNEILPQSALTKDQEFLIELKKKEAERERVSRVIG